MARYGLWAGWKYYPGKALQDYRGSFDEIDLAIQAGKDWVDEEGSEDMDWWVVVDLSVMESVAQSESKGVF